MGDVMLFGILRMPYKMAMESESTCQQYWQAGKQAANEIERLREENKQYLECLTLMAKAALTVLKPKEGE